MIWQWILSRRPLLIHVHGWAMTCDCIVDWSKAQNMPGRNTVFPASSTRLVMESHLKHLVPSYHTSTQMRSKQKYPWLAGQFKHQKPWACTCPVRGATVIVRPTWGVRSPGAGRRSNRLLVLPPPYKSIHTRCWHLRTLQSSGIKFLLNL